MNKKLLPYLLICVLSSNYVNKINYKTMSGDTLRSYQPSFFQKILDAFKPKKSYAAQQEDKKIYSNYYGNKEVMGPTYNPNLVKKTNTNTGSGGGGGQVKTNDVSSDGGGMSEYDLWKAEQERIYNSKKNAILAKLDMMKQEAARLRSEAGTAWENTKGTIKTNYDALKDLSKSKLQNILDKLTQTDVDTQNMYGIAGGNARKTMQGALTRNNLLAKALGNAGSSFYTNSKNDISNAGIGNINDIYNEETSKRAGIKQQGADTTAEFGQNDVAIAEEETRLNNEALAEYNNSIANANLLEKNYNIDSVEAIDNADATLNSALLGIKDYIQNKYKDVGNKAISSAAASGNFAKNYALPDSVTKVGGTDTLNNVKDWSNSVSGFGSIANNALAQNDNSNLYGTKKATQVWDPLQGKYVYKMA
jgi:hypothetical protein